MSKPIWPRPVQLLTSGCSNHRQIEWICQYDCKCRYFWPNLCQYYTIYTEYRI